MSVQAAQEDPLPASAKSGWHCRTLIGGLVGYGIIEFTLEGGAPTEVNLQYKVQEGYPYYLQRVQLGVFPEQALADGLVDLSKEFLTYGISEKGVLTIDQKFTLTKSGTYYILYGPSDGYLRFEKYAIYVKVQMDRGTFKWINDDAGDFVEVTLGSEDKKLFWKLLYYDPSDRHVHGEIRRDTVQLLAIRDTLGFDKTVNQIHEAYLDATLSSESTSLANTQLHAQHVLNIIEGPQGPDYKTELGDPGDGSSALNNVKELKEVVKDSLSTQMLDNAITTLEETITLSKMALEADTIQDARLAMQKGLTSSGGALANALTVRLLKSQEPQPEPSLKPITIMKSAVVDQLGNVLTAGQVDIALGIRGELTNTSTNNVIMSYIVQVKDSEGITVFLTWIEDLPLSPNESAKPAIFWTPSEPDTYSAEIFVWKNIREPSPLSLPASIPIQVT